jgi:hypothetical protein
MIVEHFILARDSSIDRDKNTMSIFDMIEELQVQVQAGVASIQLGVQAIAVLARQAETGAIRAFFTLKVLSPKGDVISQENIPAVFAENHKRLRLRMNMGFTVTEPGTYTFRFEKGDDPTVSREGTIGVDIIRQISRDPRPT